jgi:serine/threonine-protein kinase
MVLPPRYIDGRVLGEGSFGTVYAVRDTVLDRTVALKILRDELRDEPGARQRFAREIQVAALVGGHPHVATIHDAGEWRGLPYLVLELLADRVRPGVSKRAALRWLGQAASALDYLHAHEVVHRDVKPANLLVDPHGDLRLTDFGVARTGTVTALTAEGAVVGTPGYLAPEVAAGGVATAASDRYSLAVVARELLGDVPERAVAADPARRYATAAELVAALGGDEEQTQVLLSRPQAIERIPRTQAAPPIAPARRRRARRGLSALAVAVTVAAAAAGGAFVVGRASATDGAKSPTVDALATQTCALSTVNHNANIVVSGVGALRFCRLQSHALRLQGDEWTYRGGKELFVPDTGSGSLHQVCALHRGTSRLRVYDSGSRSIGSDVCRWYAGGGWQKA